MHQRIIINRSVDDITNDIRSTRDPIKRTILKNFLVIKMSQMRSEADDPSLDDLSLNAESYDTESQIEEEIDTESNIKSKQKVLTKAEKEYELIMKKQKDSLNELDKLAKIKAYAEMIDDNRKDKDQKDIVKNRGKVETMWQSKDIYDPRYIGYQKDDTMNNNLMERLNSEIDFRTDRPQKTKIEKPFNDMLDGMEEFARYEEEPDEEKRYKSNTKSNSNSKQGLGQRRAIRR